MRAHDVSAVRVLAALVLLAGAVDVVVAWALYSERW